MSYSPKQNPDSPDGRETGRENHPEEEGAAPKEDPSPFSTEGVEAELGGKHSTQGLTEKRRTAVGPDSASGFYKKDKEIPPYYSTQGLEHILNERPKKLARARVIKQIKKDAPELYNLAYEAAQVRYPVPEGTPEWLASKYQSEWKKAADEILHLALLGDSSIREQKDKLASEKYGEEYDKLDDTERENVDEEYKKDEGYTQEFPRKLLKKLKVEEGKIKKEYSDPEMCKEVKKQREERGKELKEWAKLQEQKTPLGSLVSDEILKDIKIHKEQGLDSPFYQELKRRVLDLAREKVTQRETRDKLHREQDEFIIKQEGEGAEAIKKYVEKYEPEIKRFEEMTGKGVLYQDVSFVLMPGDRKKWLELMEKMTEVSKPKQIIDSAPRLLKKKIEEELQETEKKEKKVSEVPKLMVGVYQTGKKDRPKNHLFVRAYYETFPDFLFIKDEKILDDKRKALEKSISREISYEDVLTLVYRDSYTGAYYYFETRSRLTTKIKKMLEGQLGALKDLVTLPNITNVELDHRVEQLTNAVIAKLTEAEKQREERKRGAA